LHVSRYTLIIISAVVWYSGGFALFLKGGTLVRDAYLIDSRSLWTIVAPVLGFSVGLLKAKFIFRKNCEKNIQRIKALPNPRIWQFLRPRMLLFLAILIPAGILMSKIAAGNYTLLCFVGALDLSIFAALLTSGVAYWKSRTGRI
jgi:hypothetical protein